ncbi:MAG: imidazoleglycerol-phosphate dehydratase [Spirochaetes bacterium]|nr:imidazoleglycerol-phosphate dehydratase [Spirochaetota bacterium]MBU0954795.1 imidazoleglycerol-phosphate dehydratase [Spirochaetota bacterium]
MPQFGLSVRCGQDAVVQVSRRTRETAIQATFSLAPGECSCRSGIGFLDHMIQQLVFHARWSLQLECSGDLQVDDHHSVEDTALVLGMAIHEAVKQLSSSSRIERFGLAMAPMDDALTRAVVDFSGRPWACVALGTRREMLGELSCENITHFFNSLALAMKINLHIDVLRGENDHHRVESAFKACALAIRQALMVNETDQPANCGSTKGVL